MDKLLIIGIGNSMRGDDAVGLEVARRLCARKSSDSDIVLSDGEPSRLIELWDGYSEVVAVDAVVTGVSPPGTVYFWDASENALPACSAKSSSHVLGLAEAIEFARILNKLPASLRVIGIEAASCQYSEALSPEVEGSVEAVVSHLSSSKGKTACTNFRL